MAAHARMRTLLIDNYDSYTYNLFQLLAEVTGVEPLVYKNDAITLPQVRELVERGEVHNIVISPGPGTPEHGGDVGVCLEVLQHLPLVPVLGVCLGHQALATAAGARVVRAPEPVHGRISELHHTGHELFKDIPTGQGFDVVRYHSLVVEASSLPDCLQPIAWATGTHHAVVTKAAGEAMQAQQQEAAAVAAEAAAANGTQAGMNGPPAEALVQQEAAANGGRHHEAANGYQQHLPPQPNGVQPAEDADVPLIMGLAHTSRPHWGVQFHPESICTRFGMQLLLNFYQLACSHLAIQPTLPKSLQIVDCAPGRVHEPHPWPSPQQQSDTQPLGLLWHKCAGAVRPQDASQGLLLFEGLFKWLPHTFWLDR